MNDSKYDLIIIGAGSCGSNLAYEACKRGLKVALIDAGDIGNGTSSNSTKLLHGGIRYLELAFKNFDFSQFKLVKEALTERKYWIDKVPHLAKEIEIFIPLKNNFSETYYKYGLNLYDKFSGKNKLHNSYTLKNDLLKEKLPELSSIYKQGVGYFDGTFNDSRLNLSLALTAERLGATLKTYCKLINFEKNKEGKIVAANTIDCDGISEKWYGNLFINCTGIYSDSIRQLSDESLPERIIVSKGVHLVLRKNLCPHGIGCLIPKTNDGRVLFVLPYLSRTLIGTTDQVSDIAKVQDVQNEDINYLLKNISKYFPNIQISDITSSWSGGRPLIKPNSIEKSKNIVREHEIEVLKNGLISILGGKWTTSRKIALDALKEIEILLRRKCDVQNNYPIIGSKTSTTETLQLLEVEKRNLSQILPNNKFLQKQIEHLISFYGLLASQVIQNVPKEKLIPLSKTIPFCQAEVEYSIKYEHSKKSDDILKRRLLISKIDVHEAEMLRPKIEEILSRFYKN